VIVLISTAMLLGTIEPDLDNGAFLAAMGVLGIGMGLIVSQLGNVVQSAVSDRERSEAGGLQYTAQQLGSSLGTALLGAIVITGLLASFSAKVADHPQISERAKSEIEVRLSSGGSFVPAEQVREAATGEGVAPAEADAIVSSYEDAQLDSLKLAFLVAAFLVIGSFWATRNLPTRRFDELEASAAQVAAQSKN
jgi:type II secretory pathway pseudopilin PulG